MKLLLAITFAASFGLHAETILKYTGAKITKVGPDSISVMHDSGVAKIQFEKIPSHILARIGMTAEKVAAHRQIAINGKLANEAEEAKAAQELALLESWKAQQSAEKRAKADKEAEEYAKGAPRREAEKARIEAKYKAAYAESMTKVNIGGKVLQVHDKGILLTREDGSANVWIACNPGSLVDGDEVSILCKENGTMSYTNALGAKATVRAYISQTN